MDSHSTAKCVTIYLPDRHWGRSHSHIGRHPRLIVKSNTVATSPEHKGAQQTHPPCQRILLGSPEVRQDVYIVKRLYQQLLGRPAIEALGLVVRTGAITTLLKWSMKDFPRRFKGLGSLYYPCTIQLRPGAILFSQPVVRRVAIPLMQPVKRELERMERLGVIARVEQQTDW